MAKINEVDITSLLFQEGAAPATPASTKWRLYTKTDGLYVIDDAGAETGPLGTGGGGSGAMTVLKETVVSGSAVADIDWTSIPATSRHLLIEISARGTGTFTTQAILAQFNGDTAGNYDYQRHFGNNATSGAAASVGQISARVGVIAGASADSGKAGVSTIHIPDYAGTTFHKMGTSQQFGVSGTAAANLAVDNDGFLWRSTAAINRIRLFPNSGNFDVGTVATLYGLATA